MQNLKFLDTQIQLPLLMLPVRSVVVPTKGGHVLISPGSQLAPEQLQSAGEVSDIVAPNLWHGGGVLKALKVFPNAKVWGPPGISKLKPDVSWTHELSSSNWLLSEEISLIPVQGMPQVSEFVFIHKASRTLIVTDLAFHLKNPKGLGAWLILNLFGTYDKFAVSRFFMQGVKDKLAFTQSIQQILSYDFDRIIVSHGEVVEKNGKELLRSAMRERGILLD